MTARYIPLIQETLDLKYPQKQHQEQLSLENIRFKLFLPKTTLLVGSYQDLKSLSITHCDIRNLQNFPKLPHLQQLDLGYNQIQGTFNHLIPLKRLKYLNIQDNIVFESNKFAPLKKIASANRVNQQSSGTSLKISICLRNNPFADEESAYINKLKGYGLKVVKEPKEYFDRKKGDEDKGNRTGRRGQLAGGKKRNRRGEKEREKKVKRQDSEELDSFYSGQSIVSESESSSSSSNNKNDNNPNPNPNPNRSLIPNNNNHQYHRISHRMGLQPAHPRLSTRLSQQNPLDFRNIIDNPFMDSQDLHNNEGGLMVMDDGSDEDSAEVIGDRFGAGEGVEERLRVLEDRRARLQELRGMRREMTVERERERMERLREIERREEMLRQRQVREVEMVRQLEENRERLLIRPSMLIRDHIPNPSPSIFGAMRTAPINPTSPIDYDWRVNPFSRRPSASGLVARIQGAINEANNELVGNRGSNNNNNGNNGSININGSMSRNDSNNNLNRYLHQMRALQRNTSRTSNDSSIASTVYQPLRARQSQFPSIIRLSRIDSYHSQASNPVANERQNQLNRQSQGIRFQVNDSVSNDDDIGDDDDNDENQLGDDDDDDGIDQMIDAEDDEMIHVCDDGCEHNGGEGEEGDEGDDGEDQDDQDDQEDQDEQNDLNDQEDEQANPDESVESEVNDVHNFIFPALQENNDEFEDFMMINDEIIDIGVNDWSANLQLHDDRLMRPALNNRDANPSLSSNLNPDSESNLEEQGEDEDSSGQL